MSTRSQIQVIQEKGRFMPKTMVTLYHHCDGYPEHIVPDILSARARVGVRT